MGVASPSNQVVLHKSPCVNEHARAPGAVGDECSGCGYEPKDHGPASAALTVAASTRAPAGKDNSARWVEAAKCRAAAFAGRREAAEALRAAAPDAERRAAIAKERRAEAEKLRAVARRGHPSVASPANSSI